MANSKSKVLALIPARRGSKGLPGKNVRSLAGKPLVAWTIESALAATSLDHVVVSTDDPLVVDIAAAYGLNPPFLRPADLSSDTATTVDVALHVLDFLDQNEGRTFEYLVLLEPTSPLREPADIDGVVRRLVDSGGELEAVVTVGRTRHSPALLKSLQGELVASLWPSLRNTGRRQTDEVAYFPFGVAYGVTVDALTRQKTFYPARTGWYAIQRYQEFEIDDIFDFMCVEAVMRKIWDQRVS